MGENIVKIPANNKEVTLYCFLGEALIKTQMVEQALSHSITIKMILDETKKRADEFLKKQQRYTLGQAIKLVKNKNLYNSSIQDELNSILEQRNWLVHSVICGIEEDLNAGIKEELFDKIKSISDQAESIQSAIQYDLIDFCITKGKDMSEIFAKLKLQDQGVRIQNY